MRREILTATHFHYPDAVSNENEALRWAIDMTLGPAHRGRLVAGLSVPLHRRIGDGLPRSRRGLRAEQLDNPTSWKKALVHC